MVNIARGSGRTGVVGIGVDLVFIPEFAAQLNRPGTHLAAPGRVFTAAELADSRDGPLGDEVHLAGRWAAKEALIKAWSASIFGSAPVTAELVHRDIEVVSDAWSRPQLRLSGLVATQLAQHATQLSLSHDGDYAVAYVVLTR